MPAPTVPNSDFSCQKHPASLTTALVNFAGPAAAAMSASVMPLQSPLRKPVPAAAAAGADGAALCPEDPQPARAADTAADATNHDTAFRALITGPTAGWPTAVSRHPGRGRRHWTCRETAPTNSARPCRPQPWQSIAAPVVSRRARNASCRSTSVSVIVAPRSMANSRSRSKLPDSNHENVTSINCGAPVPESDPASPASARIGRRRRCRDEPRDRRTAFPGRTRRAEVRSDHRRSRSCGSGSGTSGCARRAVPLTVEEHPATIAAAVTAAAAT